MSNLEAIEIIVNYVEVLDEGQEKERLSDMINRDFILNDEDLSFLNQMIQKQHLPINIVTALQIFMKQ